MSDPLRHVFGPGAALLGVLLLLGLADGVSLSDGPTRAGRRPGAAPAGLGGTWQTVASPNAGLGSNYLRAVAGIAPNDIWAAGYYVSGDGTQTLVLHWDGVRWTRVPSPNPDPHYSVLAGVATVAVNDVWAVGSFYGSNHVHQTLIMHWDGLRWTVVPSPNPGLSDNNLHGVAAVTAGDAWAVGGYLDNGGDQALILHWDGARWTVVPGPNPGPRYTNLLGVAAGAADDIWAVGWANPPFRPKEILTLHWDGAVWTMVPSPHVPSGDHLLTGVAVVAADDVWASGVSYSRRSGDQPLFLHWDGASWTVVPGPNPGTIGHHSLGIVAPAANDVWAAGTYMNGSGADQTLLLHWDGARWTVVPNPNPGGSGNGFLGVAVVAAGEVWAVGYQCCQGILRQTLTERYAPRLGADGPAPDPAPPIPTAWPAAEAMRRSHQR